MGRGPSEFEKDMLRRWRDDMELFRRRAAGDFGDRRDEVLRCANAEYEPDHGTYTLHPIEEVAQLLGMTVERLNAGVASRRVRAEPFGLGGPPRIPSYELARLRELVEHAAWRERH